MRDKMLKDFYLDGIIRGLTLMQNLIDKEDLSKEEKKQKMNEYLQRMIVNQIPLLLEFLHRNKWSIDNKSALEKYTSFFLEGFESFLKDRAKLPTENQCFSKEWFAERFQDRILALQNEVDALNREFSIEIQKEIHILINKRNKNYETDMISDSEWKSQYIINDPANED